MYRNNHFGKEQQDMCCKTPQPCRVSHLEEHGSQGYTNLLGHSISELNLIDQNITKAFIAS